MALNQIISLALCLIAFIILCVVVYLKMYPVKWYQYEISYWTDYHDWPEYDDWKYVWLGFKIKDNFDLTKVKYVIKTHAKKDVAIKSWRLVRTKRCKKGETP